jgi:hypothetical protein
MLKLLKDIAAGIHAANAIRHGLEPQAWTLASVDESPRPAEPLRKADPNADLSTCWRHRSSSYGRSSYERSSSYGRSSCRRSSYGREGIGPS